MLTQNVTKAPREQESAARRAGERGRCPLPPGRCASLVQGRSRGADAGASLGPALEHTGGKRDRLKAYPDRRTGLLKEEPLTPRETSRRCKRPTVHCSRPTA